MEPLSILPDFKTHSILGPEKGPHAVEDQKTHTLVRHEGSVVDPESISNLVDMVFLKRLEDLTLRLNKYLESPEKEILFHVQDFCNELKGRLKKCNDVEMSANFESALKGILEIRNKVIKKAYANGRGEEIRDLVEAFGVTTPYHGIEQGPLQRTRETEQAERILKNLLKDQKAVSITIVSGNERFDVQDFSTIPSEKISRSSKAKVELTYYDSIEKRAISIDLLDLLKRVNLNQIAFTDEEIQIYHEMFDTFFSLQPSLSVDSRAARPTEADFKARDPSGKYSETIFEDEKLHSSVGEKTKKSLLIGEIESINIYTSSDGCQTIQGLLKGRLGEIREVYEQLESKLSAADAIKETFLHAAVCISALNKLPDYVPPEKEGAKPQPCYLYREESTLSTERRDSRERAISEGLITQEMAFVSTHYGHGGLIQGRSNVKEGVVIFLNAKGKFVEPFSRYGDEEREVLFPPTDIRWLSSLDIGGTMVYVATALTTPTKQAF